MLFIIEAALFMERWHRGDFDGRRMLSSKVRRAASFEVSYVQGKVVMLLTLPFIESHLLKEDFRIRISQNYSTANSLKINECPILFLCSGGLVSHKL